MNNEVKGKKLTSFFNRLFKRNKASLTLNNLEISLTNAPYKVGQWKRTISVKQDITLTELHEVIQSLTEFADDHLFQFIVDNVSLDGKAYMETIKDCEKHYSGIQLQDVLIKIGQTIVYNFDFGDGWVFKIKETNIPSILKEGNFLIVDEIGEPFEQYR